MKKYLFLLLIFLSSNVNAYVVKGTGASSCGTYIEDQNSQVLSQINIHWVLGYITGYNMSTNKNIGGETDVPAISQYLLNYCEKNPLDELEDAAYDLIKALENG